MDQCGERSKTRLTRSARRIGADGWLPNDQDILQSRVVTTGITESFFSVGKERWRVTDVCVAARWKHH